MWNKDRKMIPGPAKSAVIIPVEVIVRERERDKKERHCIIISKACMFLFFVAGKIAETRENAFRLQMWCRERLRHTKGQH